MQEVAPLYMDSTPTLPVAKKLRNLEPKRNFKKVESYARFFVSIRMLNLSSSPTFSSFTSLN